MPKVTITLQDAVKDDGEPFCQATFDLDKQGYPRDAPATHAVAFAAAIRIAGDRGNLAEIVAEIEAGEIVLPEPSRLH